LGDIGAETANSIEQTSDGGYIIAGYSTSTSVNGQINHGGGDYMVLKLDGSGNTQWTKLLGGTDDDGANSIKQTSDGGYIVAGQSQSNDGDVNGNHGSNDYWVVKLNNVGIIQWQKSLGGSHIDLAHSIQQTTDGGYIVAGASYSSDGDVSNHHGNFLDPDYWVVKLDNAGNIQWQKSLGGSGDEAAYSIQQTIDGGYIATGYSTSPNNGDVNGIHGGEDFWIVKIDGSGTIQWQKCIGGSDNDEAYSIQQTNDGGYIVAGSTYSATVNRDYMIVKLDNSGNSQWTKLLGGSADDFAESIKQSDDGGYVAIGYSTSNNGNVSGNHGSDDYWIVKIDGIGNLQWQKSLGGSASDEASSMQITNDGGYIVAGYSASNNGDVSGNNGSLDSWIVKLKNIPIITPSGPTTICGSGSVTLTASAGGSYLWSNGATTQAITVNATGSYSVTVDGCYVSDAVSVTVTNCITHNVTSGIYCTGQNFSFQYTASGTFNAGNIFTAQLSDASGSFASPVNIGSNSSTGSGTINSTIPLLTLAGTGYKIRVVSSNPAVTSADNGSILNIKSSPVVTAATNSPVCSGSQLNLTSSATNIAQWVMVTAGNSHSLGIKSDGTLWAWGLNSDGQLGNGNTTNSNTPVQIGSGTNWISASCGYFHSLALKSDGSVWAWGGNGFGQLGDGTTIDRMNPVQIFAAGSGVSAIAAGGYHSLAIVNGSVKSWGYNNAGQLGDATNNTQTSPVQVVGLTSGVSAIAAGTYHSLAIVNGSAKGWGGNGYGQLGDGTGANMNSPVQVSGLANGVTAIAAGFSHSLAIVNGAAKSWGDNTNGKLGDGTFSWSNVPVQVSGLTSGVTAIAGGYYHSLAIVNGAAMSWGGNFSGELGIGNTTSQIVPVQVLGLTTGVTSVSCGADFSLSMVNSGSGAAKSWGDNSNGQLGNGNTNVQYTPISIVDPSTLTSYSWSGPNSFSSSLQNPAINNAAVAASGLYVVSVTGSNGCSSSVSTTATVNPNPTPTISGPLAFCSGGSTILDLGSGYNSYSWSTGATTQTITVNTAASWVGTVTLNGCSGTSPSVTTTINPNPTPTISGPLAFCSGGSTTLDLGAGYSSYNWSNGATTQTITVSAAATWSGTVTLNGCTGTSPSVSTTIKPNPTPTISGPLAFCSGGSTTLDLGAGYSSYSWSNGATTQTITVSTAAAWSGTVTLNGCTGTSPSVTTTVNPNPTPTISGPLSFCSGGSTTLDLGSGYSSYSWSTGATTQTITVNTAGSWSGTVTLNGCSGTSPSVTTTVNSNPTPTISGSLAFCSGSSTILDLGSGYSGYNWSTGATTQTISVSTAGSWSGTVTLNGCSGTSPSVTTTVTPAPSAAISGNSTICNGQSTTVTLNFSGPAPYNYEVWRGTGTIYSGSTNNPSTTVLVTPPSAGTFNYVVKSISNGTCTGTGSGSAVVIVNSAPPANSITFITGGVGSACNGDVVQLSTNNVSGQNISYNWNKGSNSSGIMFGPSSTGPWSTTYAGSTNSAYALFGALGSGESGYNVCVFASNGCAPNTNNKCQFIRGAASTPGAINGPTSVCNNTSTVSYTAGTVPGGTVYNWTFSGGASFTNQGSVTTGVNFTQTNPSGQLCVTAAVTCNNTGTAAQSPAKCITIGNTLATPAVIAGPAAVCPGTTIQYTYSVPNDPNAASYTWLPIPAGVNPVGGTSSNTLVVTVSSLVGTPNICVKALSSCGTQSASRCKTIGSGVPATPGNIGGPLKGVCSGNQLDYSVVNVPGTTYTWTVPSAATGVSPNGSNTIHFFITGTPVFGSGTVSVTATNGPCGASAPRSITIYGTPDQPATLTSNPNPVCTGNPVQFTASTPIGAGPVFTWAVTGGTITSTAPYSNQLNVVWGAGNGTVSASGKNACGVGGAKILSVVPGCREEAAEFNVQGSMFNVYPNPAHDKLTLSIDAKESAAYNVQLLDLAGRVIQSSVAEAISGINVYEMDLSSLAKGVYMLTVQSANENWKTKVVVE
jgi:alpha-tubulin suppressor-like RCC1 family protein